MLLSAAEYFDSVVVDAVVAAAEGPLAVVASLRAVPFVVAGALQLRARRPGNGAPLPLRVGPRCPVLQASRQTWHKPWPFVP